MKKTVALAFVFLSNLLFLSGCIAKTYSCTIYENTNYVRIIDASSAKLNEVRINQGGMQRTPVQSNSSVQRSFHGRRTLQAA